MAIAEKLLTIAENSRDMYLLAESKKATVSGGVAKADNVSGYEHSLGVKLSSDTITDFSGIEVSRYGKNLYDNSRTMTTDDNGNPADRRVSGYYIPVTHNTDYILSAINVTSQPMYAIRGITKDEYLENPTRLELWNNGVQIVGNNNKFNSGNYDYIAFRTWKTNSDYGITDDTLFQLELGTTTTAFEPYKAPQNATANDGGTVNGLTSLSPNITLIPNNDGVSVECTYYTNERDPTLNAAQDIKTALTELKKNL